MIIHRFDSDFPISHLLIAVLLIAVLGFAEACHTPAKSSNTIQVLLQNAPETLDPRFAMSAYASTASELIYASLLHINDDLTLSPLLAREIKQIDAVTFRVSLRTGLVFHDNAPLTAHDVAFTFQSLLDPKTSSPHREKFKFIRTLSVRDNETMDFVLHKPYAPFLSDLAGIGIVPKHNSASHNGSGPFRLASWDRNTNQLILTPHSNWFEGAPKIPFVKLIVAKDPTTRLLELLKGNADLYVGSALPKQLDVLRARAPQLTISTMPGLAYSYLAMNLRGPKSGAPIEVQRTQRALANPRVRRAIGHAINFDEIIRFKFLNLAQRASGLLPEGHWARSSAITTFDFDPAMARRLLDEAGFADRGPEGRFSLVLSTTTDRFRQSIAQIISSALNDVGIKASVRIQDWGSLFEDIKQGNFQMFSAKWLPVIEPDLLHWVFHSDNIPSENKGGGNRGAYRNSLIDELLVQARETNDRALRRALYIQVEQKLADDLPYIPLWFEDDIVIQSPRLIGFVPSRTGSLMGLRFADYDRR